MQAIIAALEHLPVDAHAVIRSDSQLCVNQLTKGWKAKANAELVEQALMLASQHPHVRFEWVKGHSGERWNEYADALASGARRGVVPLCPHVTDSDLIDFYQLDRPELTCAGCWLEGT